MYIQEADVSVVFGFTRTEKTRIRHTLHTEPEIKKRYILEIVNRTETETEIFKLTKTKLIVICELTM